MNRYYWIALCVILILVTALSTIWILELANQHQRETMSLLFTAIGTFAAIIFGILGLMESKRSETNVAISIPFPKKEIISEFLNKDNSILHYLSNLEATLDSTSKFIALTTEYEEGNDESMVQILQSFEWAKRETQFRTITITKHPTDFLSAHNRFQRYVLLGEPGSGKTTCLQYLTLKIISEYKEGISNLLPMYVRLSDWKDRRTSALEFLRVSFEKLSGSTSYLANEFEALLSRGDLIIILDGLNEMPSREYYHDERDKEIKSVSMDILSKVSSGEAFITKEDPREKSLRDLALSAAIRTRFIVSCRTHEFFSSPKWQEINILSMSDDQIISFIQAYMGENEGEFRGTLESNPALLELARNPFFLRSMIRIYSPEMLVIENRGQFLEYLCNQLLEREKSRGKIFNHTKLMKFISKFAIAMIREGLVGVPFEINRNLKKNQNSLNILIGTGLLVSRGENRIAFYHQIIQEFLAAYALRQKYANEKLSRLLASKKWSEVVLLWHDIAPNSKIFTQLIEALKTRNRPWTKPFFKPIFLTAFDTLILVIYIYILTHMIMDLFAQSDFILPALLSNPLLYFCVFVILPAVIHFLWLYSSYHQEAISNAAYVLGRIKNPIAIGHLIEAFKYANISQKLPEMAKAISNFGNVATGSLISGLNSSAISIKRGCVETLGLIRDSEGIDPLIELLKKGELKLIGPIAKALGNIGDPKVGPALSETFKLLDKMTFPLLTYGQILPTLGQLQQIDDLFVENITRELRLKARKNQGWFQRYSAIDAMGRLGHAKCLPMLKEIIYDETEDKTTRGQSLTALAHLKDPNIISELIDIANKFDQLRDAAISAIGDINYPGALQDLVKLLNHDDWFIRVNAVSAISGFRDPALISELTAKYSDEVVNVREQVAQGLGIIGTDDAIPPLLELIRDDHHDVRVKALRSLDHAFPSRAKNVFIELVNDNGYPDRIQVINQLGYYRFPEVRKALLQLLASPIEEIRTEASLSLQRIDRNLSAELRYVRTNERSGSLVRYFKRVYNVYALEYLDLHRQAEYSGINEYQRTTWVFQQIQNDSDLKRKYAPILTSIVFLGFFLCIVTPPFLAAFMPRFFIYLGSGLWTYKWIPITLISLSIISLLPIIRNGAKLKVLKPIYKLIRLFGLSYTILVLGAIGFRYWWWTILVFVIMGVAIYLWVRRRLRNVAMGKVTTLDRSDTK
jgi:HEAT repeat protein